MAKKTDFVLSLAGAVQDTVAQLATAVAARGGNLGESLVLLARPAYTNERDAVADILTRLKAPKETDTARDPALTAWACFYRKFFPVEFDVAGGEEAFYVLHLPAKRAGIDRLVVVLKGLTMNRAYDECTKHFKCWRYTDDLDANAPVNERLPTATYAVWVRNRVEADEEYKNLSANDIAARSMKPVTLLERMLLELAYFDETGVHLDISNWTLCAGSRFADGGVPYAFWNVGGFQVCWCHPSDRGPSLCVREVLC